MTHILMTGPITGNLVLADGTKVDVSPQMIEVDSPEQAAELADLIGREYAANGHPEVDGDFEYVKDPETVIAAAENTDTTDYTQPADQPADETPEV